MNTYRGGLRVSLAAVALAAATMHRPSRPWRGRARTATSATGPPISAPSAAVTTREQKSMTGEMLRDGGTCPPASSMRSAGLGKGACRILGR